MSEFRIEILNKIAKESPLELIKKGEVRYHKLISDLADKIAENKKISIVLLAGPSGSGKTTSANMLSDAIKARGRSSMVVSLDDFYRDYTDESYPLTDDGDKDHESPDSLDIPTLVDTLLSVAEGKSFMLPKYDFKTKSRTALDLHTPIDGGVIIIEGLHALNPKIFTLLPAANLIKIFISVSTNISKGGEIILSGRKMRFARRLVRDSIYRNTDARTTLSMWMNVLEGEDKYLYPTRRYADVSFDTFHHFELGVMRTFIEKLIPDELAEEIPYAKIVKSAFLSAEPISESLIPENSLIREFIPGGKYENLY